MANGPASPISNEKGWKIPHVDWGSGTHMDARIPVPYMRSGRIYSVACLLADCLTLGLLEGTYQHLRRGSEMVDPALGSRGQIVGKVMDILLREVAYSLWVSSWSPPPGGGHVQERPKDACVIGTGFCVVHLNGLLAGWHGSGR